MEWNGCWSVKTVTPFLFEYTGDSEDVKSDVHHHHEAVMDESEGLSFRMDDDLDVEEDDDDDDAQSCSYDHSIYINTRYDDDDSQHDQSQRLIYDDDLEDGNMDDDGEIDDGDDEMDSAKQPKKSHKFCGDHLLNQREMDRKFWEACLAS